MKNRLVNIVLSGFLSVSSLLLILTPTAHAAGDTVRIGPASGVSITGSSFTVSIDGHVNQSWFGTSSVSGKVVYPKDILTAESFNLANTSFPNTSSTVSITDSIGTISFNLSTNFFTSVNNQDVHLFSITFKSKKAGTAPVSLQNVSYSTGAAIASNASYTVNDPVPPPPPPAPSPTPTPKPTTPPKNPSTPKPTPPKQAPTPTPSPTPSPEPTPDPQVSSDNDGGLRIENIQVTATRQKNSVSWTLNMPDATSEFNYGLSKSEQKSSVSVGVDDAGSYEAQLNNLSPGTMYYFTIKASTPNGLSGSNYTGTLTTKGYPVQITIMQNNLLIPGANVSIGNRKFVADKNALVVTELSDGKFSASITPPNDTFTQNAEFTVKKLPIPDSGNVELQKFSLNITTKSESGGFTDQLGPLLLILVAAIAIIGGGVYGLLYYKRRKQEAAIASGQADADLISSTYGTSVSQIADNTPAPNIYTHANELPQPQVGLPTDPMVVPGADLPPAPMPQMQQYDMPMPPSDTPGEYVQSQQQPIPGASDPYGDVQQAYIQPQTAVETAPTINDDPGLNELSQEVNSVESMRSNTDEPSAVYDESTGELEIIHHRGNKSGPISPVPGA